MGIDVSGIDTKYLFPGPDILPFSAVTQNPISGALNLREPSLHANIETSYSGNSRSQARHYPDGAFKEASQASGAPPATYYQHRPSQSGGVVNGSVVSANISYAP